MSEFIRLPMPRVRSGPTASMILRTIKRIAITLNDRLRNKPGTPLAPARLIRRIARPPSIIDGTWTVPAVKKAA